MDFASVSAVLGSIKTATEIAKILKESNVSLEKAEFKLKLAELISSLADAKIEMSEIQQLLVEKDSEIRKLNEQISIKDKLEWEPPYYWLKKEHNKDGPFCQNCYDKNKELIRLQGDGSGYWECKACKSTYTDKTYDHSPMDIYRDDHDEFNTY